MSEQKKTYLNGWYVVWFRNDDKMQIAEYRSGVWMECGEGAIVSDQIGKVECGPFTAEDILDHLEILALVQKMKDAKSLSESVSTRVVLSDDHPKLVESEFKKASVKSDYVLSLYYGKDIMYFPNSCEVQIEQLAAQLNAAIELEQENTEVRLLLGKAAKSLIDSENKTDKVRVELCGLIEQLENKIAEYMKEIESLKEDLLCTEGDRGYFKRKFGELEAKQVDNPEPPTQTYVDADGGEVFVDINNQGVWIRFNPDCLSTYVTNDQWAKMKLHLKPKPVTKRVGNCTLDKILKFYNITLGNARLYISIEHHGNGHFIDPDAQIEVERD